MANSPNNTASSQTLSNILNGKTAAITSNYTGSVFKYFDLKSTYLGCAVTSEVSVGVPQACTVQFNGTTVTGNTVSESCSYTGTALSPTLVLCVFSKLDSVTQVTVTPVASVSTPLLTVEFLDNVVGNLYS